MQKKRSTVAEMEKMDMKKVPLPEKSLLEQLDLPGDLKKLDMAQCQELCQEIRNLLIETVSKTGGHLASNLGAVELTVAMHRVFTSPEDKFVWDVGHQCYTHKILTGRLNAFSTLRQEDGISGFPKPSESEHDVDRVVNRCDEERQQRKNLGQCHGYIPPFGQSLRGKTFKSRPPGALFMETKPSGRELPPAFWTQRLAALLRQL